MPMHPKLEQDLDLAAVSIQSAVRSVALAVHTYCLLHDAAIGYKMKVGPEVEGMLPKVFASKVQKSQKSCIDVGMAMRVFEQDNKAIMLKQKSVDERLIRHSDDISDLKIDVEDMMAEQEAIRQQLEDQDPVTEVAELKARVIKLEQQCDLRGLLFRLRSVEEAMEDAHTNELGSEDAIAELKTTLDARTADTAIMRAQLQHTQNEIADLKRKHGLELVQVRREVAEQLQDRMWDVLQRVQFLEQKTELDKGHFKIFPRKG